MYIDPKLQPVRLNSKRRTKNSIITIPKNLINPKPQQNIIKIGEFDIYEEEDDLVDEDNNDISKQT